VTISSKTAILEKATWFDFLFTVRVPVKNTLVSYYRNNSIYRSF